MPYQEGDSKDLFELYRKGDDNAAEAIFDRYVHRLVALARTRLSRKLSQRVDADDVVQSVFRSFFVRAREDRFELKRNGDLWRLLAAITINKVRKKCEYHKAGPRAIDKEQAMYTPEGMLAIPIDSILGDPTPDEESLFPEVIEQVISELNPINKKIIELRLNGERLAEISKEVGRSERHIRRIINEIKEKLRATLHQPA